MRIIYCFYSASLHKLLCIGYLYLCVQEENVLICTGTYHISMQSLILLGEPGLAINCEIAIKEPHGLDMAATTYHNHFFGSGGELA